MNIKIIYMLDSNPIIKKYLREHSYYYKDIIRDPSFINEIIDLAKKEYHLTIPDKLDKLKNNISLFNTFIDVLK